MTYEVPKTPDDANNLIAEIDKDKAAASPDQIQERAKNILETREKVLGESEDGSRTVKRGDGSIWHVPAEGEPWLVKSQDDSSHLRYDGPNSPGYYDE